MSALIHNHIGRQIWLRTAPNLLTIKYVNHQQRRFLDLQEYQSKQILHERGIAVQKFKIASDDNELHKIFDPSGFGSLISSSRWSGFKEDISKVKEFVIKAQVLAGGRGKGYFKRSGLAGGVKLTRDPAEAFDLASAMLNDNLVTKQTTQDGVLVEKVMVAEAVRLDREFYFAIVLDRSYDSGPILVTSSHGGMDIEEVAEKHPTAVKKFTVPIDLELDFDTARRISMAAFNLTMMDLDIVDQCANQIMSLYKLFLDLDANQIEINPLGVTFEREVICVDAKVKFDENARFRQRWLDEIEELNKNETDPRDFEARKHDLNFIGLDGSIGCLVNGAGLAMATMDLIKLHGGQPANFLDVGGGATVDQVIAALKIIESDQKVKAIFVNIFGGIMRCDTVAEGIIKATKHLDLGLPIVVRLEGTRVEEARKLIDTSGLNITTCDDFESAAQRVVMLAG